MQSLVSLNVIGVELVTDHIDRLMSATLNLFVPGLLN